MGHVALLGAAQSQGWGAGQLGLNLSAHPRWREQGENYNHSLRNGANDPASRLSG